VRSRDDLTTELWHPEEPPARDPDFSGHATSELERVRRELSMSATLAVPGSGAHLMTVTHMQAIDAELAVRRRGNREAGGVMSAIDLAGGQQRRGPFDVSQARALEAVRLDWGSEYDTGFADGAYHAVRLDGTGDLLRGTTPDELAAAIRVDWGARRTR
jgi:hypothetical protein